MIYGLKSRFTDLQRSIVGNTVRNLVLRLCAGYLVA